MLILSHTVLFCHFSQQCKFVLYEHGELRKLILLAFPCTGWPFWSDNSKILLQGDKEINTLFICILKYVFMKEFSQ